MDNTYVSRKFGWPPIRFGGAALFFVIGVMLDGIPRSWQDVAWILPGVLIAALFLLARVTTTVHDGELTVRICGIRLVRAHASTISKVAVLDDRSLNLALGLYWQGGSQWFAGCGGPAVSFAFSDRRVEWLVSVEDPTELLNRLFAGIPEDELPEGAARRMSAYR